MTTAFSTTAAATRYDAARELPAQTLAQWMAALKSAVPSPVGTLLDLGCGTGRFTGALGETFGCAVVGVEPSKAMLDVAKAQNTPHTEWRQGDAENIPVEDQAVDLVFMSQVFHHIADPTQALQEINRVLAPNGYLAIRNATTENSNDLQWLHYFPEARVIEDKRNRTRGEIVKLVCSQDFALVTQQTIVQLFASSYAEYYDKIQRRGLSSLISISDEAFEAGRQRLQAWVGLQPQGVPVYEPTDLFVFQKKNQAN